MNEQEFAELAAGHALHALSADDERAYVAALAAHPEWHDLVDADAATAVALSGAVVDTAPPLTLRSALLSRIAEMPQGSDTLSTPEMEVDAAASADALPPVPVIPAPIAAAIAAETAQAAEDGNAPVSPDRSAEPPLDTTAIQAVTRRNWTRGLFALAASFVLLLGLGFGAALIGQQLTRPAQLVALSQIQGAPDARTASVAIDSGGVATAHWSDSLGKAVLVSTGMPSLTDQQTYELWYVRGGTQISAGLMAAGSGSQTVVLDGSIQAGDTIAITVEQSGGSPTGKPTSKPVVTIPTA